jgi:hypothetical protein
MKTFDKRFRGGSEQGIEKWHEIDVSEKMKNAFHRVEFDIKLLPAGANGYCFSVNDRKRGMNSRKKDDNDGDLTAMKWLFLIA